jgi:serine/threonine protein kinase
VEDGGLWYLTRQVFRKLIYITDDTRKKWINTLRNVPTFANLPTIKLQSVVDVLKEETYGIQDYIFQDGIRGPNAHNCFYIVSSGSCVISYVEDATECKLYSLNKYDVFSDEFLQSTGHKCNVIATSAAPVRLYVLKHSDFEMIVGDMRDVVYGFVESTEVSANGVVVAIEHKPVHSSAELLENIVINGMVSVDETQIGANTGTSLCLGSFRTEAATPNVTLHSVVFSKLKGTKREHIEILRNIDASVLLASKEIVNGSLPRYLGLYHQSNVLHFAYRTTVCNDLSNVLMRFPDIVSSFEVLQYLMACSVSALQHIHGAGIVYRNIQPEGLHVDSNGRLVFMDFRMSKILQSWEGMITGKTFTLCGASEYIAPEQLQAGGYNHAVDYWALGVLLCELSSGVNPFAQTNEAQARVSNESSHSETAVFSKIMAYGQEGFASVPFADTVPPKVIELAKDLLTHSPFNRLGLEIPRVIQDHSFFANLDWDKLDSRGSPLRELAITDFASIISDGPDDEITKLWKQTTSAPIWIVNLR